MTQEDPEGVFRLQGRVEPGQAPWGAVMGLGGDNLHGRISKGDGEFYIEHHHFGHIRSCPSFSPSVMLSPIQRGRKCALCAFLTSEWLAHSLPKQYGARFASQLAQTDGIDQSKRHAAHFKVRF
jgi:hypothetical protein